MSLDTLIQLGMLIVAVATLIVAVVARYRTARNRKHGVRFEILGVTKRFPYFYRVGATRAHFSFESVALGIQLRVINNSDQAFIIAEVHAYEDASVPRTIIGAPFREIEFSEAGATARSPLSLPFTLLPRHGVVFWALAEVIIPSKLGSIAFDLYGDKAKTDESVRKLPRYFKAVESIGKDHPSTKEMKDKLLKAYGVSLLKVTASQVCTHLPLRQDEGISLLEARFGFMPSTAVTEILCQLDGAPTGSHPATFLVSVTDGTGQRHNVHIPTRTVGFWFV